MIPILYQSITVPTVPTDYGRGALSDCLGYEVTENKNGSYELVLTYPANGLHVEDLTAGAIIKAKANYSDDPQLFYIYRVGKVINGRFTINARHISYYLSGNTITSGTAANCAAACSLLQSSASGWTISTNKSTAATFTITEPSSVRSWFGGKAGSLLDVYGGEWHYDNFTCELLASRGADRGVTIRYGKNLAELSETINIDNLATSVQGYYKDTQTGAVTLGTKMSTGLSLDYPRDLVVDFTGNVDTQSATAISAQVDALTTKYIAGHVLDRAINSIKLNIVQLGTGSDRVELGDTVRIYFEALGITATARCISVTWDGLRDRYKSATFGDARTDITDTIATTKKEAAQAVTTDALVNAVNHATSMITGNSGGYVVLHDSDNDGQPDEILIMNTPSIATATKVWRWNKSGLGYSSTGYAGTYGLAMTADGQIVANFITTGTLNADLIKAGTISDANGNSSINMTTGAAVMNNFTSKMNFYLVNAAAATKAWLNIDGSGNTWFSLRCASSTNDLVRLWANDANGSGVFNLLKKNGNAIVEAGSSGYGGSVGIRNDNDKVVGNFMAISDGGAYFSLANSAETQKIYMYGSSGSITCVSLTQTSSRKVKENIAPLEDGAKILELDAVSFDYKDKAQGTNKRGFIAEDVAEVLPNLVTPETDEHPATLDYIGMIPYLQDCLKQQAAKIKELEERIKKLEG